MPYKNSKKQNEWMRKRYSQNRKFINEYKLSHGCKDCGYKEHHAGLEFDHIKPKLRKNVSALIGSSIRVIKEEIERCEVVCAICHNIRTWNRRDTLENRR